MKQLKKKLDEIWKECIKARAGFRCEICGQGLWQGVPDAHHIYGRNESVRWDLDNGISLCRGCHTGSQISAHSTSQKGRDLFNKKLKLIRPNLNEIFMKSKMTIKHSITDLENIYKLLENIFNSYF